MTPTHSHTAGPLFTILPRTLNLEMQADLGISQAVAAKLSGHMLLSLEVAVEYWLALSWSPQAQWLSGSGSSALQREVRSPDLIKAQEPHPQSDSVPCFIGGSFCGGCIGFAVGGSEYACGLATLVCPAGLEVHSLPLLLPFKRLLSRSILRCNGEKSQKTSSTQPLLEDTHVREYCLLSLQAKLQSQQVWKFIINREIEAPSRFKAIQTYRAAMAIFKQQQQFVGQLYTSGKL